MKAEEHIAYGEYSMPFSRIAEGGGDLELGPDSLLKLEVPISSRMEVEAIAVELRSLGGYPIEAEEYLKKLRIDGRAITPEAAKIAEEKTMELGDGLRLYVPSMGEWEEAITLEVPDGYLLDIEASRVVVGGDWLRRDLNLSMLDEILKEKALFDPKIHYCFPGAAEIGPEIQRLGSLVTQGIALRYGDTMPQLTVSTEPDDEADTIVIGTYSEVAPYMRYRKGDMGTGAYLEIGPHPDAPHRIMIVVAGSDYEQVRNAACMFGLVWTPLPEASGFSLSELQFPETPIHLVRGPMYPNQVYAFKDLGYNSQSARVGGDESMVCEFRFAADTPFYSSQRLEMDVRLSQTGRERQSVDVQLLINGESKRIRTFNLKPGPEVTVDTWRVPMSDFEPGMNRLVFTPKGKGGNNRLRISLDDASRVRVPGPSSMIGFPDLRLLGKTAHPLANVPDGSEMHFRLVHPDSSSAVAMWLFAGRMAQVSGTLFYDAEYGEGEWLDRDHLILVGRLDLVSGNLLEDSILTAEDLFDLSYTLNYKDTQRGWLPKMYDQMVSTWADENALPESWSLTDEGLLYQFSRLTMEANYSTVTLLTTGATGDIGALTSTLMRDANWNQLDGEVAIWEPGVVGKMITRGISSEAVRDGTHYDSKLPYFTDLRFGQWMTWIAIGLVTATFFGRIALEHVYRSRL